MKIRKENQTFSLENLIFTDETQHQNETGKLKSSSFLVNQNLWPIPTLEESYDAKSYHSIENNIYP